jgi:very-short-patch-repair endonuclease
MPWKFSRSIRSDDVSRNWSVPRAQIIELDFGQHAERLDTDDRRNAEIARHGYRVIRFSNGRVLDGVLETIRRDLGSPATSPGLSAPEGRRRADPRECSRYRSGAADRAV